MTKHGLECRADRLPARDAQPVPQSLSGRVRRGRRDVLPDFGQLHVRCCEAGRSVEEAAGVLRRDGRTAACCTSLPPVTGIEIHHRGGRGGWRHRRRLFLRPGDRRGERKAVCRAAGSLHSAGVGPQGGQAGQGIQPRRRGRRTQQSGLFRADFSHPGVSLSEPVPRRRRDGRLGDRQANAAAPCWAGWRRWWRT